MANSTRTAFPALGLWKNRLPGLAAFWTSTRFVTAITAGLLLALSILLFGYIQFGTEGLVGTDGYYHAKMGLLIRDGGLKPDFIWLPNTILNEKSFYDHHLLYHLYLALFTTTDPAADGGQALTHSAKVASVLLPSLIVLAIWWLLKKQGLPWSPIWALALFALSEAFLYRMSMARAQSASLLFLLLGVHLLISGKYRWLFPLGFAYVWLYNAFPLLVLIGGVFLAVVWLTERRFVWQAVVYPLAGIIMGLIFNPYFPENIAFIVNHLLPKIGDTSVRVGNEWYPYESWTLVENSGFALAAVVIGVAAVAWRKNRADKTVLFAFSLTILFGFMLLKSRRFIEYFPAFALLFMAISVGRLALKWSDLSKQRRWLASLSLIIILVLATGRTVQSARDSVGRSKPADQYADASSWLIQNSEPGSLIFQTDWDDFPRLFFYNSENIYTVGLDPTYLELFDPDLYEAWVAITKGKVDEPGSVIRSRFGASLVLTDLKHKEFVKKAEVDPLLTEVYRDEFAVIYRLEE